MKHSKFKLFIGLLLVMTSVFSLMIPAAAADAKPLHYVAFDNEYYHDAIGNAYGFTGTEYIDIKDDANVSGAIRLTFEKSPYEYNGTYDKNGHTGVFDPYMYLPVYEMGEDIKCDGIGAVVVYVRFQNKDGHDLVVNQGDKANMYIGTADHPILNGQGDVIGSVTPYKNNSGEWIKLIFNVGSLKEWKGDLQLLRLDPLGAPNDDVDFYDVAGFATFENVKAARSFDGNFKALRAGSSSETATSSFSLGAAFACIIAAFGINGDLLKKKKVRRAVVVALVAVMALGLVACGSDTSDKSSKAPAATDSETVAPTETVAATDGEDNKPTDKPADKPTDPDPEDILKAEKLVKSGESGDYEYELYETYAKITRYNGLDLDVTVPAEFEGLPVKIIGYKAFFRNYNLKDDTIGITKLTLPDSLVILDDYALAGLEEAVEIVFGKELYKIGSNSVENCYSLKKLTFTGTKLRVIESWAFSGDRVIEEITIPDGVTTIENAAFQYCHSLAADKLSIPASVTTKGKALTFACTPMPDGTVWP